MKTVFLAKTLTGAIGVEVKETSPGIYKYGGKWGAGSGHNKATMLQFLNIMLRAHPRHSISSRDSSFYGPVKVIAKNPAKRKRRSLKNPALDYGDEATASELASYMHSVYKNGKALRAHLKKIAKTSAYSEAKYIAFLVKSHLPTVAVEYYGNARDAKQYATAIVKKRAAELFIEDTLDGSYD